MKESSFAGVGGLKIFTLRNQKTRVAGVPARSQRRGCRFVHLYFSDHTGSTDKTLKLYEGHYHDLLNHIGKEVVMPDITNRIDAPIPATETKSVGAVKRVQRT